MVILSAAATKSTFGCMCPSFQWMEVVITLTQVISVHCLFELFHYKCKVWSLDRKGSLVSVH